MNVKKLIAAGLLTATLFSCKKESATTSPISGCTDPTSTNYNPSATVSDGSCQYQGQATFWYNSGGTNATVVIHTITGNFTAVIDGSHFYTSVPACGSVYCANFTLPTGIYSYTASSTFTNWTGTVNILKNSCSTVLLQ